jgi:hypothetical protein
VDMGKSQKDNKKEYRVLNGSLDLIEYYQIFGCDRHKYQIKETITDVRNALDKSMTRLKPIV